MKITKNPSTPHLPLKFLFKLAWKESRGARKRLFLFSFAVFFGVASLVAVNTLAVNLEESISAQAKVLLGADLLIKANKEPTPEAKQLFQKLPQPTEEISFTTMASSASSERARFSMVKAIEGEFPIYGLLETEPGALPADYQNEKVALIDPTLLLELNLKIGERIRLGQTDFEVVGSIKKYAGDSPLWEAIAPRIIIGKKFAEETALLKFGSRLTYKYFYKLPKDFPLENFLADNKALLSKLQLNAETVKDREKGLERILTNVRSYLSLAGFLSLLLGTLGVAAGVEFYLQSKVKLVALLRCVGARRNSPMILFGLQILAAGLLASLCGALIGAIFAKYLPQLLTGLLPQLPEVQLRWPWICLGVAVGTLACALSSARLLFGLRFVSPLVVLRSREEAAYLSPRSKWMFRLLTGLSVLLLSLVFAQGLKQGVIFALAALLAFLVLEILLRLQLGLFRKFLDSRFAQALPYVFRQGVLNLFRHVKQTEVLSLVLSSAVLLLVILATSKELLLQQVRFSAEGNRADTVLFDIQADQVGELKRILESQGLKVFSEAPFVTMRLLEVNNKSAKVLLNVPGSEIPEWTLRREYRSSYRGHLKDSERLISGEFIGKYSGGGDVPIAIEVGLAEKLKVTLGDTLLFDVQGREIKTYISSLRKVEWQRIEPNFFILFPEGVLEAAPQTYIVCTKSGSKETSVSLQRQLLERLPNISLLDTSNILEIVSEVLEKFAILLKVMASCLFLVALSVLLTLLQASFKERVREQAVLKVLGARRIQLLKIILWEYLALVWLCSLSGLLVGSVISFFLGHFLFETGLSVMAVILPPLVYMLPLSLVLGLVYGANTLKVFGKKPITLLEES